MRQQEKWGQAQIPVHSPNLSLAPFLIIVAGTAYFGAVYLLGFVLGVVRTLIVAPATGQTLAVLIELPLLLGFAWLVCGWLIRKLRVPGATSARLLMGATAFGLLMLGEFAISTLLGGRNLAEHLALYRQAPHLLGLAGQIAFALFPAMHPRIVRAHAPYPPNQAGV